jgi:Tfp pilus assembly protein PilV
MMDRLLHRLRAETGTTMVEVLAAAVILIIISGALTSLITGAQRESGQTRVVAIAGDLAQSELEQLRAKRFTDLTALTGTSEAVTTAGGQKFTVTRSSKWASQSTDKATSCSGSANTPSALRVSVSVDWATNPRAPVQLDTLVAAPIAEETNGNFVVQVNNRDGDGVPAVSTSMSGPESASGQTDANGCIRFGSLAAGTYTVTISKSGYVDVNHQNVVTDSVTVKKNDTGSTSFEYDQGGGVWLRFAYIKSQNPEVLVNAPVAGARFKGQSNTVAGVLSNGNVDVKNPFLMWPQTAPYSVLSDSCDLDTTSLANATVLPGVIPVSPTTVKMPQLQLTLTGLPARSAALPDSAIKVRTTSACGTVQPEFSGTRANDTAPWVGRAAMPPGTLSLMCAYGNFGGTYFWKKFTGVTLTQADIWPGQARSEDLTYGGTGVQQSNDPQALTKFVCK